MKKIAVIDYTNHSGIRRNRRVRPRALAFTSDEWHTTPCWMLLATDLDNGEERTFAFANIHRWLTSTTTLLNRTIRLLVSRLNSHRHFRFRRRRPGA